MIHRALVITNPASRRGRSLAQRARKTLERHDVDVDVLFTAHPGHAAQLAAENGPKYDAVFALGGDGTVMEVAGALSGTSTPIGVLAGGTGNLLARALGIPLSVRHAVPALLKGDQFLIDLGRFESDGKRSFAIAAGVGIDAAMVAETPGWLKRRLGVLAYTMMGARAALRSVLRREFFHTRVVVDGEGYERDAVAVMVANFGAVLGDRITLGPGIRTDDGLLDVCMFSPRTLGDAIRISARLLRGRFEDDPCMLYVRGKRITVETSPPRPWQADGELMGPTPFTVRVEPLAVRLLVPHRA